MSKKMFALVSGIVGGLQAIGVAVVTYTSPEYATAINSESLLLVLLLSSVVTCLLRNNR